MQEMLPGAEDHDLLTLKWVIGLRFALKMLISLMFLLGVIRFIITL